MAFKKGDRLYINGQIYEAADDYDPNAVSVGVTPSPALVNAIVNEPIVEVRKQVDIVGGPIALQSVVTDPIIDIRHKIEVIPQPVSVIASVNDAVIGTGNSVVPDSAVVTTNVTDPNVQIGDQISVTVTPQPASVESSILDVSIRTGITPDPVSHSSTVTAPTVVANNSETIFTMNFVLDNANVELTDQGDFELV